MSILDQLRKSQNSFEGRLPDEQTILVLREHWFSTSSRIGALVGAALVPFILYALLITHLTNPDTRLLYWLMSLVFLMFIWLRLFYEILKYLMDIWIVTNHRIIDEELHGFFNRSISEIGLDKIQDVTIHIKGIYQTFLNFGDIEVQSAGEKSKFTLRSIPNPNEAKTAIVKAANGLSTVKHHSPEPQL